MGHLVRSDNAGEAFAIEGGIGAVFPVVVEGDFAVEGDGGFVGTPFAAGDAAMLGDVVDVRNGFPHLKGGEGNEPVAVAVVVHEVVVALNGKV